MEWDRVERLLGSEALSHLDGCRVAVLGLGSGGGFVALSLAMAGIGGFVLVDPEDLEEENIVRHVADRRYLGWPKVEAVADMIANRNPDARVETHAADIRNVPEALAGVDIVVAGLDGEGAKFMLNEMVRPLGLPTVYAGVYERGEGGDVCIIHTDRGPCYACWALALREGVAQVAPDSAGEVLDYGMIGPDGTLKAEPGLWLDVVRIASIQAEFTLNELLRPTPAHRPIPANTVIIANTTLEIVVGQISLPFTAEWVDVPHDPDCMICGGQTADRLSLEELAGEGDLIRFEEEGEHE